MSDTLTTITTFINSPPGQLLAGATLAGIVWKFFERVESLLTEQTKFEIAVWLLERKKFSPKVEPWPNTFAKVFDRFFGTKHASWKCFGRSSVVTIAITLPPLLLISQAAFPDLLIYLLPVVPINVVADYLSLLKTRLCIRKIATLKAITWLIVGGDALLSLFISFSAFLMFVGFRQGYSVVMPLIRDAFGGERPDTSSAAMIVFPAFFTSIWLWLYAGSGFILKAARRFDIGFQWFNAKFDIEKKPLQSIGLVAGALVAIVYWTAVIVSRLT